MKRMNLLQAGGTAIVSLLLVVSTCQAYQMVWENNYFGSDEGNWTMQQNNYANGNNFGWVNSSLAGGTPGELGGRIADFNQTTYLFRSLDYTIDLNHEMHFRGKVTISNPEAWAFGSGQDINVWVGYFSSADPDNNRLGWRTYTPSASGATQPLRGRARVNGGSNYGYGILTQDVSYNFEAHWVPSGLNNGYGTYSGFIGSYTWNDLNYNAGTGSYDVFGLVWKESTVTVGLNYYAYFDNFEYLVPVPEPSAAVLVMVGGGLALWLRRRV